MRKKIFLILVFLCAASILSFGTWSRVFHFTAAAVNCAADDRIVNGTDFNSRPISVKLPTDMPMGAITIEFIPESDESVDTIDFDFEVSANNGANWALFREEFDTPLISIPLATPPVNVTSGLVRVTVLVNLGGISHIRWREAVNNDTVNDVENIRIWISL